MIAGDPLTVLKHENSRTRRGRGLMATQDKELLAPVEALLNQGRSSLGLAKDTGLGVYMIISYDAARYFERLPDSCVDDLSLPDLYVMVPRTVLRFDHRDGVLTMTRLGPKKTCQRELDQLIKKVKACKDRFSSGEDFIVSEPQACMPQEVWLDRVERTKEYIKAGDVFQVNLSQRFSARFSGSPWALYERLRAINPSPFAGFVDFGEGQLLCSSPERLLKVAGGHIETRPIGGTCRRGGNAKEDSELAAALLQDPKERAEHIMLVDLERNDLGKSSMLGSVRVDELMVIERYSHVNHIVSNVVGILEPDLGIFDALQGMFPGGTITGCPKVRCMEIIDECEDLKRGFYTGSLGYAAFDGTADFNIIIRSLLINRGNAHIQVGAGIVHDSSAQREYVETIEKAQAMFRALKDTYEMKLC